MICYNLLQTFKEISIKVIQIHNINNKIHSIYLEEIFTVYELHCMCLKEISYCRKGMEYGFTRSWLYNVSKYNLLSSYR